MVTDPVGGSGVRPLRLALFTGNYNYIRDGVALTLNRLVGWLESRGVEVVVVAPVGPEPAFPPTGRLIPVPSVPVPLRKEYRIGLGLPARVRAELRAFRPTLVHIAVPDIVGHRALALAERWRVPAVASFHSRIDTYLDYYRLGFLQPVLNARARAFYRRCEQLYVPSQTMIEVLAAEGVACEMRLWSRGVDAAGFNPSFRSLDWRRRHGIGDDEVVVAYAGRLVAEKNMDLMVKVFALLAERVPAGRHRILVIGDGPAGAALRAALPQAVFPGFLVGDELATAYASADVFFFPSVTETFGNVTLEAMASGLPAVNAVATGSSSLVVDGETGYLAEAGDGRALAERLARLVVDADLRRRMSAAGLARAGRFSWDAVMAGLHGHYLEVLARTGREPVWS